MPIYSKASGIKKNCDFLLKLQSFAGAPGGDRTRGLLIRSETLYPLSYERICTPGTGPAFLIIFDYCGMVYR